MSTELMFTLITKMHLKLNKLIEENNYDLLNENVQHYSRRLDKVLCRFNKITGKSPDFNLSTYELKKILKCAI
ncbi:UNVERIFIED_CONTAM: hypothetical protein Cloal_1082 [Acetivibrio alkalicellulosi]